MLSTYSLYQNTEIKSEIFKVNIKSKLTLVIS